MLKWLWLSFLVLLVDQFSKYLIVTNMQLGERVPLLSFIELNYVHNPGVALGMLQWLGDWGTVIFVVIALLVSILVVNWLRKLSSHEKLFAAGLSLVLGGAIGNVIDRFIYTDAANNKMGVVDFIHVYVTSNDYFPFIFNVADSAISIGVALILIYEMFYKKIAARNQEA